MLRVLIVLMACIGVTTLMANERPFGQNSIMSESRIAERVIRNGDVCLQGESCAGQKVVAPSAQDEQAEVVVATGPRSGDQIYASYCAGCHDTGAANAPKAGDAQVWNARLENRGSREALWKSAWTGLGAMPPKGLCMDCSEDEFSAAVAHILEVSR